MVHTQMIEVKTNAYVLQLLLLLLLLWLLVVVVVVVVGMTLKNAHYCYQYNRLFLVHLI